MPAERSHSPTSTTISESALPACRDCHRRKKKCDRTRPKCKNCFRSGLGCEYEIPSSHNHQRGLISRLIAENESHRQKIEQLERRVQFQVTPPEVSLLPSSTISVASTSETTGPSLAERIVTQVMNADIDLGNSGQSAVACIAQHLRLSLADFANDHNDVRLIKTQMPTLASLPPWEDAVQMVERFMVFGNLFSPLLNPDEVMREELYSPLSPILLGAPATPDVRLYRMFLIFAIGCNALSPAEKRPDTTGMRACAFAHFPAALRADDMTGLSCVALFSVFSVTDPASMGPYQNIQIVGRLAVSLGYHLDDKTLPLEEQDMRRRIFWSIYVLDRCMAFTLNRPVAIPEEIIATALPSSVPSGGSAHLAFMTPLAWFQQLVYLRRLQGIVVTELYHTKYADTQVNNVFGRIRNQIETWYKHLPRGPTSCECQTHPFLEAQYHLLLVRLYSPSPLMSQTQPSRIPLLRASAYRVMEMYAADRTELRTRQNYPTLAHLASVCVALVYSLKEADGDPSNMLLTSWRQDALKQLESAQRLLGTFCLHAESAEKYMKGFAHLASEVKARLESTPDEAELPSWVTINSAELSEPSAASGLIFNNMSDEFIPWTSWSPPQNPFVPADTDSGGDFEALLASFGLGSVPSTASS